jgi:hypothetical protein
MNLRHIRPRPVANTHVFASRYHGEVELVVNPTNNVGFKRDDVVDIPRKTGDAATLCCESVCLTFKKIKEFIIKRMSCRKFNGSSFCGMHHGFEPDGFWSCGDPGPLHAPAGNNNAHLKAIARNDGKTTALTGAEPPYISFPFASGGRSGHHNKASKLHTLQVFDAIRPVDCGSLAVKAPAGLGASVQKGSTKDGFEFAAVTSAAPHAHADFSVAFGAVSCKNLKPSEPHSGSNLGCSINSKAPARLRVRLFEISGKCANFISALANTCPANRRFVQLLMVAFFNRELSKYLPGKINKLCHDCVG